MNPRIMEMKSMSCVKNISFVKVFFNIITFSDVLIISVIGDVSRDSSINYKKWRWEYG